MVDNVVFVYCDDSSRTLRISKKESITLEEAQRKIRAVGQMPQYEKRRRTEELGGIVIDNSGSIEETQIQVNHFYRYLLEAKI